MTCKHCGEHICDPCWQKRADILIERDDLRAEVAKLRDVAAFARCVADAAERSMTSGSLGKPLAALEAALGDYERKDVA